VKSIQRVVKNGSSAQVTIIRQFLFRMNLVPGDFVQVDETGDGGLVIRPWKNQDNAPRVSPGLLPPDSPLVRA
jgi:antitoxin component of MazEF toxin-antitoxin module